MYWSFSCGASAFPAVPPRSVRTYSTSVLLLLTSACFALVMEDDLLSKHSFTRIETAAVQTILVRYILKK